MNKKLSVAVGILVVSMIAAVTCFTQIGGTPTDTRIVKILEENRENLLSVVGVVGAGIARDEGNQTIGIAVYVEDYITDTQQLPSELSGFNVFVKSIDEASEFEKDRMIIRNLHYQLLKVTTDKTVYQQNDNVTIIVKNESNETVTFSNSVYDLFFKRWNGVSWEFYTGVVGLEVLTYLNPEEKAEIAYKLGGQTDKPFPAGKYRVISIGWLSQNEQRIRLWGYAEFTVE